MTEIKRQKGTFSAQTAHHIRGPWEPPTISFPTSWGAGPVFLELGQALQVPRTEHMWLTICLRNAMNEVRGGFLSSLLTSVSSGGTSSSLSSTVCKAGSTSSDFGTSTGASHTATWIILPGNERVKRRTFSQICFIKRAPGCPPRAIQPPWV